VELQDAGRNAPAGLVRSILLAMQQNTAIQSVDLRRVRLFIAISSFVDTASSITSFSICECDMDPAEREQGVRDLMAALQRNTNIERLELNNLNDICKILILEGLRSNTSLKTVLISPRGSFSDEAAHALQCLLESMTSIQRFELRAAVFRDERWFRPIAQGITSSECVSELIFRLCSFPNQSSIAQLQSILQNKRNLSALCLQYCSFAEVQVHEDIISVVSRPGSLLRCFEFISSNLQQTIPNIYFETLLRAIQTSKLERFSIGRIVTSHHLQALAQSIPSMKLKELLVEISTVEGSDDEEEDELDHETIRQDLLHAMKNNFTLQSVHGEI